MNKGICSHCITFNTNENKGIFTNLLWCSFSSLTPREWKRSTVHVNQYVQFNVTDLEI